MLVRGINPFLIHAARVPSSSGSRYRAQVTQMRGGAFVGGEVLFQSISAKQSGHDERASRDVLRVAIDMRFADRRDPTRSSRRVLVMGLSKVKRHPNWPLCSVSFLIVGAKEVSNMWMLKERMRLVRRALGTTTCPKYRSIDDSKSELFQLIYYFYHS